MLRNSEDLFHEYHRRHSTFNENRDDQFEAHHADMDEHV